MINFNKLFTTKAVSRVTVPLRSSPEFWPVGFLGYKGEASKENGMQQGYASNPYIFAVIDKIAESIAALPRHFVNIKGEEVSQVTAFLDLIENPNPKEGLHEFYYRLAANMCIAGECFVHAWKPIGFKTMSELIVPNALNVDWQEDNYGRITAFQYHYFGKQFTNINPDDFLHIFRPNVTEDTNEGFSALEPGAKVYRADNELRDSKALTFKNRGASGIIFSKGMRAMTPAEQKAMQDQLVNSTGGNNRDQIYFAPTEMGHIPMGVDGNLLKAAENEGLANLRDACRLYGIDSKLFGDPSASTYNNQKEAKESAYTDVYIPMATKIDRALSQWILGSMGVKGVYWVPDKSKIEVLKNYNRTQAEILAIDIAAGIITADEARAIRYPNLAERKQQNQPTQ